MDGIGKIFIVVGLFALGVGSLILLSSRFGWLPLGRLPGDISYHREGFSLYFPITTMILISVVLSLITRLIGLVRR
jgi:Protein of unknown function (DUF2905)